MNIERNFNKYLFELVQSNLPNNKLAKTIALNYSRLNRNSKESFFESLMPAYNTFTDKQLETIKFEQLSRFEMPETLKDFRLKAIRVANVRGIPNAKNNIKFGFDLVEKKAIKNMVILGPNGTGKSSLFGALEYIYTQRVSEKDLRTENPNSNTKEIFLDYLAFFNSTPECEIETPSGKFSLRNSIFKIGSEIEILHPNNHFISDNDIYRKGQIEYSNTDTDHSFHLLIANNLGLQEYLDFNNLLKSLSAYRRMKESTRRKNIQNDIDNLKNEIGKNENEIKTKSEKINALKNEINNSSSDNSKDRLLSLVSTLKQVSFKISFNRTEYIKALENYKNQHEIFIGLSVNPDLLKEAQFLSLGLELINSSENCPLCQNSSLSISAIKKLIEHRIADIKEFEQYSKTLEISLQKISNEIRELNNSLNYISNLLKNEIERINAISEFETLKKQEIELREVIEENLVLLNEFDKKVFELLGTSNSLSKKDELLFESLSNIDISLSIELPSIPNAIQTFEISRQKYLSDIQLLNSKSIDDILPSQQIIVPESEINNHKNTIANGRKAIENYSKEIEQLTRIIETINLIKQESAEFAKILEEKVNFIVASTFGTIKETITEILRDYIEEEDVILNIYLKEEVNDDDPDSPSTIIVAEVQKINKETGEIVGILSPSKYFNTFRYRLFCMMVSISIVIASRKTTGINLPLVMDDIFYASDYNSKITFKSFILKILDIFRKFNGEMPLQFILFSHDELVFDSTLDAITEFEMPKEKIDIANLDEEWLLPIYDKTIFARLFSANEIDEAPSHSVFGDYWDLTYRIPYLIQQQLLKENLV